MRRSKTCFRSRTTDKAHGIIAGECTCDRSERELSAASRGRTMVDSTHCSQCNGPLIEVDFYGERMIGCIECNRWTRDGWIFIDLPEEDIEALRAERAP